MRYGGEYDAAFEQSAKQSKEADEIVIAYLGGRGVEEE
jgi:hypothetical protein